MNWNFDSSTQHSDPICDFQCDSKWQSSSSNRLYGNNELEIPALVRTLEPQCDQSSPHKWTLKAVFRDLFCLGGPKSFKMFKSLGLRCRRHTCKVVLLTSLAWCFLDLLILMTYSGVVAWQAVFYGQSWLVGAFNYWTEKLVCMIWGILYWLKWFWVIFFLVGHS